MAATPIAFGDKMLTAAAPWGVLSEAVRARTAFFHHVTLANNHGDQPKVMRLMGATTKGEMLVSALASHLTGCHGTVQAEPVAIGARGSDVLLQFLVESVVLSLFGGCVGIALGYGLSQGLTFWLQWPTAISLNAVAVAFGFAGATGVFFGFYPARKAAALDPIEALRFE